MGRRRRRRRAPCPGVCGCSARILCCGSVACWYDESDDDAQSLRMEETRDDVLPAGEWLRAHVTGFVRGPPRWAPPEIGTGDFAPRSRSCRTRLAAQRWWFTSENGSEQPHVVQVITTPALFARLLGIVGWSVGVVVVGSAAGSAAPSALVKEEPPSDVMTEEHDASEPASDPDHASFMFTVPTGRD